ncbi:MAG: hypothetical protein WA771_13220 [Chthoniobacterales bacterium]
MTLRFIAAFLLSLSLSPAASAATYQRAENFAERPPNWRPSRANQTYGFSDTRVFRSTGGPGGAGGLFSPTRFFNYYGDTFLNGSFTRNQPLSASGRIALSRNSARPPYVGTTYVAHFAQSTRPFIQVVGMAISGSGTSSVNVCAIIQFANGQADVGKPVQVRLDQSRTLSWSYDWNPNGGEQGLGVLTVRAGQAKATLSLDRSSDGGAFAVDSFGLFQPPFPSPNSNSFIQLFIGQVDYSAMVGNPPALRINAPRNIRARKSEIRVNGSARVAKGNRVVRVRYRLKEGNKSRRFRTADGTKRWSFQIRVPRGRSRLEVLARSDDGTVTTKTRTIRR